MALFTLSRVFNSELKKSVNILSYGRIYAVQSANMTSKELRDPNIKKPKPWPYKTKRFTYFHGFFEGTLKRFDENTKLIVVEGNIGAGKSAFAKELAEAFEMVYMPEPTMESYYISSYGIDLRKIDDLLPPSFKCCDINTFYSNPHHLNVGKFQFRMYMLRLQQYIDALAHMLNTGQGVVLERCAFSDFVFLETMHKFGYITDGAKQLYKDITENTLDELFKPHLIVYLDVSPEVALQRIKERNNPVEVNSKVLTKEYLESIDYLYKQSYLKDMEKHSELLIYDWSNYGEVEVIVEDIERIDFDRFSKYDKKLRDWRKGDDFEWNYYRRKFTNQKDKILNYARILRPRVTELHHPGDEVNEFQEILDKIPGEKYDEGFNPDAGDNVWFKTDHKGYRHQKIWKILT